MFPFVSVLSNIQFMELVVMFVILIGFVFWRAAFWILSHWFHHENKTE